ncbi:MAG: class D sortase [Pseudomonadota bacterium]
MDATSHPAWAQRLDRAPDQSTWSRKRIAAFAASVGSPGEPVGVLHIPAVELEVPVYSGASEINLNRGAAHIDGTTLLGQAGGNIGIAAHRDGFFRKLKDVRLGQELFIEHGGSSRRYLVSELGVVPPTDVGVLAATATPSVTLITCYPFHFIGSAPLRYVVRAELDTASLREAGGAELAASMVRDSRTRRSP